MSMLVDKGESAYHIVGRGRTTDGSTISLLEIAPRRSTVYLLSVRIMGYDSAGNNGAGYSGFECFKCDAAGVVTKVSSGTVATQLEDVAINAAVPTIDTDGTKIRVRITGVVGFTIDWAASATIGIAP